MDQNLKLTDQWVKAIVLGLRDDGAYDLLLRGGEPVTPALETGIRDEHLRSRTPNALDALTDTQLMHAEVKMAAAKNKQVKKAASEAAGEVPAAGFAERATVQDILRQMLEGGGAATAGTDLSRENVENLLSGIRSSAEAAFGAEGMDLELVDIQNIQTAVDIQNIQTAAVAGASTSMAEADLSAEPVVDGLAAGSATTDGTIEEGDLAAETVSAHAAELERLEAEEQKDQEAETWDIKVAEHQKDIENQEARFDGLRRAQATKPEGPHRLPAARQLEKLRDTISNKHKAFGILLRQRKTAIGARAPTPKMSDRVFAEWNGRGAWYPGKISGIKLPQQADPNMNVQVVTYTVLYDDGDSETQVPPSKIHLAVMKPPKHKRPTGRNAEEAAALALASQAGAASAASSAAAAASASSASSSSAGGGAAAAAGGGAAAAAGGGAAAAAAAASAARGTAAARAVANDRDQAERMQRATASARSADTLDLHAQHAQLTQHSSSRDEFVKGDKVLANWKNRGQWYPGKIVALASNDNSKVYSIQYDDGDREDKVAATRIKKLPKATDSVLNLGDRVMGAYLGARGGHGHWYPGKISKVNKDGTYTIAYNDGDIEDKVPADRIKKVATADDQAPVSGTTATLVLMRGEDGKMELTQVDADMLGNMAGGDDMVAALAKALQGRTNKDMSTEEADVRQEEPGTYQSDPKRSTILRLASSY